MAANTGRSYFESRLAKMAADMGKRPHDLTPEDIRSLPPLEGLKRLHETGTYSDIGRTGLKLLTPEETIEARVKSEELLNMPPTKFDLEA